MDNQVQTIVCPNCGASATNHHNCEYCGSFLVQRAAEGHNVSRYVEYAKEYSNPGLSSAIKVYSDLLQQHPEETSLGFNVCKTINLQPNNTGREGNKANTGFELMIPSFMLAENGREAKLKNSPLIQAFKITKSEFTDDNGYSSVGNIYTLDFGYDYEGASKVILQLLELFNQNIDEGSVLIYDMTAPDTDELLSSFGMDNLKSSGIDIVSDLDFRESLIEYNSNGVVIEDSAGIMTKGYQAVIERRQRLEEKCKSADKALNKAVNKAAFKEGLKQGCAGTFAVILVAGAGSIYGIVELFKYILS
ncbi:MAG: hypothetical protein IKH11_02035 [Bacteroidales bacterium]|nr:hypothetical protein [Bacteroidales bacterium]